MLLRNTEVATVDIEVLLRSIGVATKDTEVLLIGFEGV